MNEISRREFIKTTAARSGVAGFLAASAAPAQSEPPQSAHWKPGLAPAVDAQGLSCIRQDGRRDRCHQARALFADRLSAPTSRPLQTGKK